MNQSALAHQGEAAIASLLGRRLPDAICQALSLFLLGLQSRQDEHLEKEFAEHKPEFRAAQRKTFHLSTGAKKYVRVYTQRGDGFDRSAWCFVDLETGDIFKCDGWKRPEKNFPRGNVLRGPMFDCWGPYGGAG